MPLTGSGCQPNYDNVGGAEPGGLARAATVGSISPPAARPQQPVGLGPVDERRAAGRWIPVGLQGSAVGTRRHPKAGQLGRASKFRQDGYAMVALDTHAACCQEEPESVPDVFGAAVAAGVVPDRRAGEARRCGPSGRACWRREAVISSTAANSASSTRMAVSIPRGRHRVHREHLIARW